VYPDVDRAEGVDRGGDELVGRAGLGQVAGVDRGLARDLLRSFLGDVGIEVVDQDLRPLACEKFRGRPPDSPCGAGHDRRFTVKKSHSTSP
jgi:hypothetical protein